LSLVAAVVTLIETISVDIATVKDCVTEHQSIIAKATKGPLHDAKQALAKVMFKVNAMEKKSASTLDTARAACAQIAKDWLPRVSAAFRELREKKGVTGESLFSEMSTSGKISEDAFCAQLGSLLHLNLPRQHAQLVFSHVGADGIGLRAFLSMLEQYYKCVRQVDVTDAFPISNSKSLRPI